MQSLKMNKNNAATKSSKFLLGPKRWNIQSIMQESDQEYFVEGTNGKSVLGVAPIEEAHTDDLAFCSADGEKAYQLISASEAGIILCKESLKGFIHPRHGSQFAFVDNPKLAFVQFVNRVKSKSEEKEQPHSADKATSSERDAPGIFANSVISSDAKIGRNCRIGNFVVIGKNCEIGDNTTIHDRVSLVQNCTIGNNCIIQSGVTLGEDGFAFERHTVSQKLEKFPHFGRVVIGNNVEVSANCSIARGSLSDTIIGDGTKLDALVHIAHNVKIGKNCQLTAGTIIGGSSRLGDSCWTGLNCTIKNKVSIGNNVIVGAGACVIKDIPDDDIVAGVPAKSIKNKVSTNETFQMAGQKESKDLR